MRGRVLRTKVHCVISNFSHGAHLRYGLLLARYYAAQWNWAGKSRVAALGHNAFQRYLSWGNLYGKDGLRSHNRSTIGVDQGDFQT